ncbi:MAG TPA: hypothetical protein PLI18_14540, partial [Pirellulaceae bacterium]|nr:hypothetical protein [Pirellulaceae bacterium]
MSAPRSLDARSFPSIGRLSRRRAMLLFAALACCTFFAAPTAARADDPIRIGIIGLDTSHSIAFTELFNAASPSPEVAGFRVTVAYPHGSADIPSSVERIPGYVEKIRTLGVTIVDSIPALLEQCDVVLLETNDGRLHLEQYRQ